MNEKKKEKKYNTQELLSLNMDRLKEYMNKLQKEAASPESTAMFEIPARRSKTSTRIRKTPAQCRVLAVYKDPFKFVELVGANDQRPKTQRFTLERAEDYKAAVSRMARQRYDLVLVSTLYVEVPDSEDKFGPADFILLCQGLMRQVDVYFLAKKRWFVVNCAEGMTNQAKVDFFRKMKESYSGVTFVFVQEDENDRDADFLSNMRKVRVVKEQGKNLAPLFSTLDLLAVVGPEE